MAVLCDFMFTITARTARAYRLLCVFISLSLLDHICPSGEGT